MMVRRHRRLGQRLAWFVLLWAAGVVSVAAVAWIIRLFL
jgi:hypothetical protein